MDGKELMNKFGKKLDGMFKGGSEQGTNAPQPAPASPADQVSLKDIADKLDKLLKAVKEGNASLKKIETSLGPIGPEEGGKRGGK